MAKKQFNNQINDYEFIPVTNSDLSLNFKLDGKDGYITTDVQQSRDEGTAKETLRNAVEGSGR